MGEHNNSRVWKGDMPEVQGRDISNQHRERRWNALDPTDRHPFDNDTNDAQASIKSIQQSYEQVVIIDSADVEVITTDTQAAISIQAAIQAAISLVISISIADSNKAEQITQDLFAGIRTEQVNRQQTYIENSRGVRVHTTDTDAIVNIQILLQLLVALLVKLDIL